MTKADSRIHKRLDEHNELMERLLADFSEMSREQASKIALDVMEGKRSYPIYLQHLG